MKKILFVSILTAIMAMCCLQSNAQFTFSVSPGLQFNSAAFGYKISKFVPFIGLQVLSGSANMKEKGQEYDPGLGILVSYEDEYKFSGAVYMPTIGTKYFFIEKNKLKAYGALSFTKFLLSGKVADSNDPSANSDFKDEVSNIHLYGGQFGFGTEYFFDDNFSIGGEFGIRLLHVKYHDEYEDQIYDPNIGGYVPSTTTFDYKLNINPTYSKVSLNYYFGK